MAMPCSQQPSVVCVQAGQGRGGGGEGRGGEGRGGNSREEQGYSEGQGEVERGMKKAGVGTRGGEGGGAVHRAYPGRDVWVEQILHLLIVNLEEHDAHSAACCALLSLNAFEKLPAIKPNTMLCLNFEHKYKM